MMEQMKIPLTIDITTGDKITPKEIEYNYKLLFENREIKLMSYNLETIISEKLHAILSLGEDNTRMRDYYDVYMLYKLYSSKLKTDVLYKALNETCKHKNTLHIFDSCKITVQRIKEYHEIQNLWKRYQKEFTYASDIDFISICDLVLEIMENISTCA